MTKSTDLDRARDMTRDIAYANEAFRLWGILRASAHNLGMLMDTNGKADQGARKFVADLYAFADDKCKLSSDWLEKHQPELETIMSRLSEGSD